MLTEVSNDYSYNVVARIQVRLERCLDSREGIHADDQCFLLVTSFMYVHVLFVFCNDFSEDFFIFLKIHSRVKILDHD